LPALRHKRARARPTAGPKLCLDASPASPTPRTDMKRSLMIAVLSLLLTAHSADAVEASAPSGHKDCEELKQ
jgi:hypothetical protein